MMVNQKLTRRQFVGGSLGASLLASVPIESAALDETAIGSKYKVFWGDLHNHNAVGYAKGSLERSFRIARSLLDFYAFTPHSCWHDMPKVSEATFNKFHSGFRTTKARWPDVLRMCAEYHEAGSFVTFPGYEWHSSNYGDYCLIFPYNNAPLQTFNDLEALQAFAREKGIIMIPHHPANRQGNRGANFQTLKTDVSPVLEIYSEWGNAERDDAPQPYIRHSHGGSWTRNTWQYALKQGLRLGAIASTDDHFGYPGAYREGLVAALAPELTREAIYDALKNRRTYGVTGDRIELDFRLNGHVMGESIPYSRERDIAVQVSGWDDIESVEIVKNGRVIHRNFPIDRDLSTRAWKRPVVLRIQYGWGPWASLDNARVCDWDFRIEIADGAVEALQPCFQSGPCEETKADRIFERTKTSCRIQSFTSRRQAFAEDDTKAVALKISGAPETRLKISMTKPIKQEITKPLRDFVKANDIFWTGSYPSESLRVHRLAFADRSTTDFSLTDRGDSQNVDWYYVRVKQANEQLAWSSPVWVEAPTA